MPIIEFVKTMFVLAMPIVAVVLVVIATGAVSIFVCYLILTFFRYMIRKEKVVSGNGDIHSIPPKGFISWSINCIVDFLDNIFTRFVRGWTLEPFKIVGKKKLYWLVHQPKLTKWMYGLEVSNGLHLTHVVIDVPFEATLEVDGHLTIQNGGLVNDILRAQMGIRNSGVIRGSVTYQPTTPSKYKFVNRGTVHNVTYSGPYVAKSGSIHLGTLKAQSIDAEKSFFADNITVHEGATFRNCIFAMGVIVYYDKIKPIFEDCIIEPWLHSLTSNVIPKHNDDSIYSGKDVNALPPENSGTASGVEYFDTDNGGNIITPPEGPVKLRIIEGRATKAEQARYDEQLRLQNQQVQLTSVAKPVSQIDQLTATNLFLTTENQSLHQQIDDLTDEIELLRRTTRGQLVLLNDLDAELLQYRAKDPKIIAHRRQVQDQEKTLRIQRKERRA